jgi:hypothetical protein
MDAIVAALKHTPWWVFLIFVFVVARGVAALRTRTAEISRLALLPAIFAVWGGYSLFNLFDLNAEALAIFAIALLAGAAFGLLLSHHGIVRADQNKGLVEVSGSPVILILVLIIFASKYALAYWVATDPGARYSTGFLAVDAIVSGLVIGIFIGRFAGLWRRYKAAPTSALALTP